MFFVLIAFMIDRTRFKKPRPFPYLQKRIRHIISPFILVFCNPFVPIDFKLPPARGKFVYLIENVLFLSGIFSIYPLITIKLVL